jgi:hypothetical protein
MTKQRYEKEISEILDRLERQERPANGQRRPPRPIPPRRSWSLPSLNALPRDGRLWLAAALGLPIIGLLLQTILPGLALLLAVVGILIFLSPLVLRLFGLQGSQQPRLWRGRVIEMPNHQPGFGPQWRYRLWSWRQRWQRWRRR